MNKNQYWPAAEPSGRSSPPLLAGGGWGTPLCIGKQEVGTYSQSVSSSRERRFSLSLSLRCSDLYYRSVQYTCSVQVAGYHTATVDKILRTPAQKYSARQYVANKKGLGGSR
jgi:hypothetical protein